MRWPWASNSTDSARNAETDKQHYGSGATVSLTDWRSYLTPQVVIPTAVLTGGFLIGRRVYALYFRRIPGTGKITSDFWRKRSLFGTVTSVGDGDGFRLFHTPGGRLTGWGWFPGRSVPSGKALKDKTVRSLKTIVILNRTDGTLDFCSDCWHRCARGSTLWKACTARSERGTRLAHCMHWITEGTGIHLQERSIRSSRRSRVCEARIAKAGCGTTDVEERVGNGLRGQDWGRVRPSRGEVPSGGEVG